MWRCRACSTISRISSFEKKNRLRAAGVAQVSDGPHIGEPRILLDFDSPAGVVGQVEMQHVEFVDGHSINGLFQLFFREKVPGDVDHQAPPRKPWTITDLDAWDRPFRRRGKGWGPENTRVEETVRSFFPISSIRQPGHTRGEETSAAASGPHGTAPAGAEAEISARSGVTLSW